MIDDEQVLGSPFYLELLPGAPALEKTVITGSGLTKAQAGENAVVNVKLLLLNDDRTLWSLRTFFWERRSIRMLFRAGEPRRP